jgi:hypothetical protein
MSLYSNWSGLGATSVNGSHFDPAFAGRKATIRDQFESQLVDVESQAPVQVADEDNDVLNTQVGLFPARAKHTPVRPRERGVTGHRRDYNGPLV